MHGRRGGLRSFVAAWTVLAALQTPACASDWASEAGRLRHRDLGISLADAAARSGWERIEVEGARLAYRGPDGAVMSFLRECGPRREREPRTEARQLLLGLEKRRLVEDRALRVAGAPGWLQRVEAQDEDREAHLKTVTRVAAPCREDWVLATPGPPGAAEEVFDAWWGSYRPAGPAGPAGPTGPADGEAAGAGRSAPPEDAGRSAERAS